MKRRVTCRICHYEFTIPPNFCPKCLTEVNPQELEEVEVVAPEALPPEVVVPKMGVPLARWAENAIAEGSFHYARSKTPIRDIHHKRYWGYYPVLRSGMYDREVVELHASTVGAKVREKPEIYDKEEYWTYFFSGRRLVETLRVARPYFLGRKAKQADMILQLSVFYIPYVEEEPPPPRTLSIVKPEELLKIAEKRVKIIPVHAGRPPPTAEEIEEMRRLRREGKTLSEIADEVGYGKATVWRYIKEII